MVVSEGETMKRAFSLCLFLCLTASLIADTFIIGTGTSSTYYAPFYGYYNYNWSKLIYTADELYGAGLDYPTDIIGLAFCVGNSPSNYTMLDQRVYLRLTTVSGYESTDISYPGTSGFTYVYQSDITYIGSGWVYLLFDSPFPWDAASNLELLCENWDGAYANGYPAFNYTSTSPNYRTVYKFQDSSFPSGLTGTRSYNRPNLMLITPATSPPSPPLLTAPVDGATGVAILPTFSWTLPPTGSFATGYRVYCDTDPYNYPPTQIANVTGLSYTPTEALNYSTTYYWRVTAYNDIGESDPSELWHFTTRTDPTIYILPWLEDFGTTGTAFPPLDWTRWAGQLADPATLVPNSILWSQDNWRNDTGVTPVNWSARMNIYSTGRYGWIITPPVQIPAGGYQLEFDLALTDYYNYAPPDDPAGYSGTDDKFVVLIGDGTVWSSANILCQYDNAGSTHVYNDIPYTGTHVVLPLDATGPIHIAFYGESTVSNADNDLFVDNVLIRQTPSGPPDPVTILTPLAGTTGLPRTGFNLSWAPAQTGGIAESYAIYASQDEATVLSGFLGATTNLYFNPVTEGGLIFDYDQQWYWTVMVINSYGSAAVEPPPWFVIQSDPTVTPPYVQNFDGASIPFGWDQMTSGGVTANRWFVSATTYAGGSPNEMMASWVDQTGISRLITPPIDTEGISQLCVRFKHFYNDYGPGATIKLQYSHDLVDWYDSDWSFASGGGNILDEVSVMIQDITANPIYMAWTIEGNHYQFYYWYVDDVYIYRPAPGRVTLAYPPDNAVDISVFLTFAWSDLYSGGTPTGYKVYCDANNPPTTLLATVTGLSHFISVPLTCSIVYHWMVVPFNQIGDAIGNTVFQFTTIAPLTVPCEENFDASDFPPGWCQTFSGGVTSNRWSISPTNYAGGEPNELLADWVAENGYAYLYLPPLELSEPDTVRFSFDYYVDVLDGFAGDETTLVNLQCSSDGVHWYELGEFLNSSGGDHTGTIQADVYIDPGLYYIRLTRSVNSEKPADICIDNITIKKPIRDLGIIAIYVQMIIRPEIITPKATVKNFGNITAISRVWIMITHYPEQEISYMAFRDITLDPGDTLHISFSPTFWPDQSSVYKVKAYLESSDDNVLNNEMSRNCLCSAVGSLPYIEKFDSPGLPDEIVQQLLNGALTNKATRSATNKAGGETGELKVPANESTRITLPELPPLEPPGLWDSLIMKFKYYIHKFWPVDPPGKSIRDINTVLTVQYCTDGYNWIDLWSADTSVVNEPCIATIALPNLIADHINFSFVVTPSPGDSINVHIDDITVAGVSDVGPFCCNLPRIIAPGQYIPTITVCNYESYFSETFPLTLKLGANYNHTVNVIGLPPASARVIMFPPFTAERNRLYNCISWSSLDRDIDRSNDTLKFIIFCPCDSLPSEGHLIVYADAAYDPLAVYDSPSSFCLFHPWNVFDLPAERSHTTFIAGADWIDGSWYGAEYDDGSLTTDNWWNIDPLTGVMTNLGETGVPLNGVAYDMNNRILYGCSGTHLYTLNPATGAATLVGSFDVVMADGITPGLMIGIAYSSLEDVLYGVDIGTDALYTIDRNTGAATFIGYLGFDFNYAQDIAISQSSGLLYMAGYTDSGALYWIYTGNGTAIKLGDFPGGVEMSGFAIPHNIVPQTVISPGGVLSWEEVNNAVSYKIYSSPDPDAGFTFQAETTSTSWVDPNYPEEKRFYKVTAVREFSGIIFDGMPEFPPLPPVANPQTPYAGSAAPKTTRYRKTY